MKKSPAELYIAAAVGEEYTATSHPHTTMTQAFRDAIAAQAGSPIRHITLLLLKIGVDKEGESVVTASAGDYTHEQAIAFIAGRPDANAAGAASAAPAGTAQPEPEILLVPAESPGQPAGETGATGATGEIFLAVATGDIDPIVSPFGCDAGELLLWLTGQPGYEGGIEMPIVLSLTGPASVIRQLPDLKIGAWFDSVDNYCGEDSNENERPLENSEDEDSEDENPPAPPSPAPARSASTLDGFTLFTAGSLLQA